MGSFATRTAPLALLLSVFAAACGSASPPPPTPLQSTTPAKTSASPTTEPARKPASITLLYTSDEHGWLESVPRDGVARGGVAEFLGQLVKTEGHCPGTAPAGINTDEAFAAQHSESCKNPRTLLLSGGDNFTGPAISTYFLGEPMAESMARLGYAASAFGNHEFDFGRQQFPKNRDKAKMRYLAANVRIEDAQLAKELDLRPFEIFERQGIRIGVIGLATIDTLRTAMAERFVGMTFEPMEGALERTIPKVWETGVDAVITIAHECPDVLVPVVAKHPEWKLSFVGGGHCHKKMHERVGELNVMSAEWRMHQYVRVVLNVDPSLPAKSRVVSVEPSIVDVLASASPYPDPVLKTSVANWKQKVDQALGVVIGHNKGGIGPEHTVGQLVAAAWLAEVGGDVAIINKGGIRQAIPAGPITHATLWGVLPFDNRLMKLSVSGEDLEKELERPKFIAAGAEKRANGKWFIGGKPLDKKKRYTVLITDFMYTGGDGSMFGSHDPKGVALGTQWRDPVIAWIEKQKSKVDAPLDAKVEALVGKTSK